MSHQLREELVYEVLDPTCRYGNGCGDLGAQTFFELFARLGLAPDDEDLFGQHARGAGESEEAGGLRQMEIGELCSPLLQSRLRHFRDLRHQHQDSSWDSVPLNGVDDDEASVAVHELMDDTEAGDAGLDEVDARR